MFQGVVADLVGDCEMIPPLHFGMLYGIQAFINEHLSGLHEQDPMDLVQAETDAEVVELQLQLEQLLQYFVYRYGRVINEPKLLFVSEQQQGGTSFDPLGR